MTMSCNARSRGYKGSTKDVIELNIVPVWLTGAAGAFVVPII